MDKKAQATSWSFEETGRLLLRILAVIVLIVLLVSLAGIFFAPKEKPEHIKDLERIATEIEDLERGDSFSVPVLSEGYDLFVVSIDTIMASGINQCKLEGGNYCVCIKDDDVLGCVNILKKETDDDLVETDVFITSDDVAFDREKGVHLEYRESGIFIT